MSWVNSLINAGMEVLSKQFTLTSNWGGLNSQLIATIAPCDKNGQFLPSGIVSISAPFIDAEISQQFNWSSPFESYTTEAINPTLAAALQTGMMPQLLESITQTGEGKEQSEALKQLSSISSFLQQGEGRTGITKLNSTQVFTGNEPLKINGTLVFRAYADPETEVAQPILQLMKWVYPQQLADGDMLVGNVQNLISGPMDNAKNGALVNTLFPSIVPLYVKLKYRGVTYAPLVVESISRPLTNPTCALGDVYATVQINFSTHRSWDKKDIETSQANELGKFINESLTAVSKLFK